MYTYIGKGEREGGRKGKRVGGREREREMILIRLTTFSDLPVSR